MTASHLDQKVAQAFYGRFTSLRPAQADAIQPILQGEDVVLCAGTGTGKTEAVLAPLISKYLPAMREDEAVVILYIVPTKALVNDIQRRMQLPLDALGVRIGCRHGDRDDLKRTKLPHIVITTPESLEVLLFRKDRCLAGIRAVVIDEVHLLYNTQRGLQLSLLLNRLRLMLKREFQWIALSATLSDPSEIGVFLFGDTKKTRCLNYPTPREIDAHIRKIHDEGDFVSFVHTLLGRRSVKLLVFANARRECERLTSCLKGIPELSPFVFPHYSSLSQEIRESVERKFAVAKRAICVATSTLELGIDIGDIDAILLWGAPGSLESFLQRIGRGNRRASKANVICLIPPETSHDEQLALRFAALIQASSFGAFPRRSPYELSGALIQQALSIVGSENGSFVKVADLAEALLPKSTDGRALLQTLLDELSTHGYLRPHGFKHRFGGAEKLYRLIDFKLIYGNFPMSGQEIEIRHGSRKLGAVPSRNLLSVRPGCTIRYMGRPWRATRVSLKGIEVEPCGDGHLAVELLYPGHGIPVDSYIINHMWLGIHADKLDLDVIEKGFRSDVADVSERLRSCCSASEIPHCTTANGELYLTFAGKIVNRAVALIAGARDFVAGDYFLTSPFKIQWQSLPTDPGKFRRILPQLIAEQADHTIYQDFLPDRLRLTEDSQQWLKDHTIQSILARLGSSKVVESEKHLFDPWLD